MHARMMDQAKQKACIEPYKVPVIPLPNMHLDPQHMEWDPHGWAVSSLLDATPPPSRSGPKSPKGGGLFGGGGASRRGGLL